MNRTHRILVAAVALAPTVASEIAIAQTAQTAQSTGLEEIVVTARKRAESLLETPMSVTALTADAITDRGIKSLFDVASFTPGLQINNAGGAPGGGGTGTAGGRWAQGIVIRGIPKATVFIDGAPAGAGIVEDIDDVERVEVLKGPQSAYFGRLTFAGAINIVTKPPTNTFSGQVTGLLGSDKWSGLRATVEGPILPEKLAFRLSGRLENMDGPYKNNGAINATMGGQNTHSIGGSLLATPNDNLRIQTYAHYTTNDDGPPPIAKYDSTYFNCNANVTRPGGALNATCGVLPDYNLARLGQDGVVDNLFTTTIINNSTRVLNPVFKGANYPYLDHAGSATRVWHANLKIDYDVPGLGATLTALSAFNAVDVQSIQDQDLLGTTNLPNASFGTVPNVEPFINFLVDIQRRDYSKSQELRMVSAQDQRFRWIVGGNYEWHLVQTGLGGLFPTGPTLIGGGAPTKTKTWGAFYGLTYDIVPNLTLDISGRYQSDNVALWNRPLTDVRTLAVQNTFKNYVQGANLTYRMTNEVMFYGTFGQGINPGSFNSALLTLVPIQLAALNQVGAGLYVQPEKINNFELGMKGRFLDNRLQFTVAGFYERWTNRITTQTSVIPAVNSAGVPTGGSILSSVSVNIGLSDVKGVEFDGTFAANEHLIFNIAGSLNDSKIVHDICVTCANITGIADVSGKALADYPKWSGVIGAQYTDHAFGDWNWKARADFSYQSGVYPSFSNINKTEATERLNLHLGIETARYSIEGFVLNVFDCLTPLSPEDQSNALNFSQREINALMPMPRQFGVRGTVKF